MLVGAGNTAQAELQSQGQDTEHVAFIRGAEEKSLSWPCLSSPQLVGLGSIKVVAAGNGTKQGKGPIIRGQHHQAGTQTVHGKNNPSH